MFETAGEVLRWLRERWVSLPAFWKLLGILGLGLALWFAIDSLPGFTRLQELFTQANPRAQITVLGFAFITCIALAIFSYERGRRADGLKAELKDAKAEAIQCRQEARALQDRWDLLLRVESREQLWQRPTRVVSPPFMPAGRRQTRFLTMLNLKGGVGKTTLTANLGAILALDKTKRVLLVDIDFQGTLSDAAVDRQLIQLQATNGNTAAQLLSSADAGSRVTQLAVPMNGVPGAWVILADDRLEQEDYAHQARFFVDPTAEARYFYLGHFHCNPVLSQFDLVVFDCPPRLTTSTVNALACSDVVIIPTKLDNGSVNAVPRTINWLQSLTRVIPARLAGIVATQTAMRSGQLTRADRNSYTYLVDVVAQQCPGQDIVFKAPIPASPRAVASTQGLVASVDDEARQVFRPFVQELITRLQL